MAAILRIFPAKRRKTESESAHHETGLFPMPNSVSLSTLLAAPSPSSSASSSSASSSSSTSSHRRQMSAGSFKPGLPPVAPRIAPTTTRRRESNNNNNMYNNHLRNNSAGVSTSSNIPDLCTQSNAILEPDSIRMVLIDVDSKCLYDTTTVIPIRKNGGAAAAAMMKNAKNLSNCKQFELLKRRKDTRMLTQLLFGAVPTESGSDSFKIHILDDEEKILVSKTFYMPKPDRNKRTTSETQTGSSDSDSQTTIKSLRINNIGDTKNGDEKDKPDPTSYFMRHTPLTRSTTATPEQFTRVRHVSMNLADDDQASSSSIADCSTTMSSSSSIAASTAATMPRAFSPPHRLSRNRRRQMAAKTSLSENGSQGLKSRSRFSSINSSQTEDDHGNARHVALGLLFPGAQRHFLFQHMPLIEAEMSRFESRMITIGQNPPSFFINTHNAWNDFVQTVCCLHNAPRLRNPVWLSLNEHVDEEKQIGKQFCDQLAYLLNKYETKETGFFISKLVSTILMHHMSWVASVASPPVRNDPRLRESSSMLFGMATNEDAHALGYNAHMAQYLELSGSCGPHRSAKTVLCGDDAELLATLCQVLSFFIRCSAVQHVEEEKVGAMLLELPIEQAFSPIDDVLVAEKLATSPIDIPSPPTEEKSSDDDTIRKLYQHQRRKLRREAASQAAAASLPALLGSPSSSVDSLPSVVTQTTSICVIADDNASSITIIDRIEYPPCCDHHSTTDDEEATGSGQHGGGGSQTDLWSPRPSSDGLARSLFAGPLTTYCPHFVVSSIVKNRSNWAEVVYKMEEEMRSSEEEQQTHRTGGLIGSTPTPAVASSSSSTTTTTTSPYEVQLPENILIVGDINDWGVRVLSSAGCDVVDMPPEAVVSMFEQFMDLYNARLDLGTDFLLSTIEDALAQIVSKSFTLVEMVARDDEALELTPERVRTIVGCDHSDLRLIVNVAAVYCPPVLSSVFG